MANRNPYYLDKKRALCILLEEVDTEAKEW